MVTLLTAQPWWLTSVSARRGQAGSVTGAGEAAFHSLILLFGLQGLPDTLV